MQFNGINFSFGKKIVFKNYSLIVPSKMHAFTGKNGSGKTTLLRILSGYYKTNIPEVNKFIKLNKANILYFGVEESLVEHFTLNDHLAIYRDEFIRDWKNEFEKICEELSFHHLSNKKINTLSTGESKKALFIIMMLFDKRIKFIDEPFESVEINTQTKMIEILKNICDNNFIIISTHVSAISSDFTTTNIC